MNAQTGQRFKRIDYTYDLISGKTNTVYYQAGEPDAFYHQYAYDADNRVTKVYTSQDSIIWDEDARYTYYAHGPQSRVELGDNNVQGIDNTYTLQGWTKGVNSNLLKAENDMGKDGLPNGPHPQVAKDAFGYTLNYHTADYQAIDNTNWNNTAQRFEAVTAGSDLMASRHDLFNGNIGSMVTTIMEPKAYTGAANETPNVLPQGTAYRYDQLNRLLEMKAFQNLTVSTNKWDQGFVYNGLYHNAFKYDANGNILGQLRADEAGIIIDSLTYKYAKHTNQRTKANRLYHVNDQVSLTAFTDDIDNQGSFYKLDPNDGSNNYRYDSIGNLMQDKQEEIKKIEWTVYGKIKSITRFPWSLRSDLEFRYDARGNRIAKIEKPRDAGGLKPPDEWIATYYGRDGQGNIMGIYRHVTVATVVSCKVTERNIYGASRLGSDNAELELVSPPLAPVQNIRTLGNKHFEGGNHLGNVLAVFSDRKIQRDNNGDGVIDYFEPQVTSSSDYSPFGVALDGRNFGAEERYGFNGKENDKEIKGVEGSQQDYGMRNYDPRLGRFLSLDPISKAFPMLSPYQFASNRPIDGIDLDGLEYVTVHVLINADGSLTEMTQMRENHYLKMTDADIERVHHMPAKEFYKKYSAAFESEGRGVKYVYHNEVNGPPVDAPAGAPIWQSKQGFKLLPWDENSKIARHGIWAGAGGIIKVGADENKYPNADERFGNIDEIDELAKAHDLFYDYEGYKPGDARFNNYSRASIRADQAFLDGIQAYIDKYDEAKKNNTVYIDKVTKRAVSDEAIATARQAAKLFRHDIKRKEKKAGGSHMNVRNL